MTTATSQQKAELKRLVHALEDDIGDAVKLLDAQGVAADASPFHVAARMIEAQREVNEARDHWYAVHKLLTELNLCCS